MIQQKKRKHGHCTLLTCVHSNRTQKRTKREDERQENKRKKREESKIYN